MLGLTAGGILPNADGGGRIMATVLVVDDNLDICRALGKLVRRRLRRRVDRRRRRSRRSPARPAPPDLVILDEMMPGVDGLQVLRQIRDDPRSSSVPVIMFTAMFDESFRERAMRAPARTTSG